MSFKVNDFCFYCLKRLELVTAKAYMDHIIAHPDCLNRLKHEILASITRETGELYTPEQLIEALRRG